jgi:hypothetical protein
MLTEPTRTILTTLSDAGLLLVQDKHLPNVVTVVTGETLETSWWSHAKSHLVFAVLTELSEQPDVLFVKLLKAKVTLVHRRLWPALLTTVSNAEPWQMQKLSAAARRLLESLQEAGEETVATGAHVKELEIRLLAHTREIHTESGRHAVAVQSWSSWARSANVKRLRSSAAAKKQIEKAAAHIGAERSALPW